MDQTRPSGRTPITQMFNELIEAERFEAAERPLGQDRRRMGAIVCAQLGRSSNEEARPLRLQAQFERGRSTSVPAKLTEMADGRERTPAE